MCIHSEHFHVSAYILIGYLGYQQLFKGFLLMKSSFCTHLRGGGAPVGESSPPCWKKCIYSMVLFWPLCLGALATYGRSWRCPWTLWHCLGSTQSTACTIYARNQVNICRRFMVDVQSRNQRGGWPPLSEASPLLPPNKISKNYVIFHVASNYGFYRIHYLFLA